MAGKLHARSNRSGGTRDPLKSESTHHSSHRRCNLLRIQLAPPDRAMVANAILASLDGLRDDEPSKVRDAWSDEIRSRIDDIHSG
ncbi:hypothetical protein CEE69_25680 [Rhodopirellula bahusiensis]|uniref:Uncharacterized protein n=1 Tax=Rhodopirellula bahusiensis TaxID=2014065 RepID=A0A2G1W0X3_9BACT|nr:hypothetical protein CEE69_25680 [Rhodopirellula bahusiensis]